MPTQITLESSPFGFPQKWKLSRLEKPRAGGKMKR